MIPYGHQDINENDINAVIEVLRSDYLTQGPTISKFEKSISDYCGVNFSIAFNSATSALHTACKALEVGDGDLVWTSPISFVASANCVLYCGGKVDFVDIDPITYNISNDELHKKLEHAKKAGNLPKVLIVVHMAGSSPDLRRIHELSNIYGFKIIEDASHALGGKYLNEPVGNCHYSDITIFSFHPVKMITTGEGGAATTNKPDLASKLKLLSSHGITRNPHEMRNFSNDPWYYEQIALGYNYRMTDFQAALGISQMSRLDEFVSRRRQIAIKYNQNLKHKAIKLPVELTNSYSSWHLYIICLNLDFSSKSHKEFVVSLRNAGIGATLHYIPIYKQPYYTNLGFPYELCKNAEKYYKEAVSLPIYPGLSDSDQDKIINKIKAII